LHGAVHGAHAAASDEPEDPELWEQRGELVGRRQREPAVAVVALVRPEARAEQTGWAQPGGSTPERYAAGRTMCAGGVHAWPFAGRYGF
jgi:hypothetical protein